MSTTATLSHNLPEFPYSPSTEAKRHLSNLLSSSHYETTVVSGASPFGSASDPVTHSCAGDENAHPSSPPSPSPFDTNVCSADIVAHPPTRSQIFNCSPSCSEIPSLAALFEDAAHTTQNPFGGVDVVRSKSSKHGQPPSRAYSSKIRQPEWHARSPGRRSRWRRLKRLGNRFATPLRSMGLCFSSCTGGRCSGAFCEDFSTYDASSRSSCRSSGEHPPEFIRAVLENNALR